MANEDRRHARVPQEGFQFVAQLVARANIKRRERFVEQEQFWTCGQRARQGGTLLFAGAEILRKTGGEVQDAELPQQVRNGLARRPMPEATRAKTEGDIPGNREVGEEAEILEHEPDPALLRRQVRHVPAMDHDSPGMWAVKSRDHFQADRLAGAIRAEQHQNLAGIERHVDVAQGELAEGQAGCLDFEACRLHRPPPEMGARRRAMPRNRINSASDTMSSSNAMAADSSRPDSRNSS